MDIFRWLNPANWGRTSQRSLDLGDCSLTRRHSFSRISNTGVVISRSQAMQNATFRACILRPSSDLATLSFPVYDHETRTKQKKHQVYGLLNRKPSANQTPVAWRQKMFVDAMIEGNGLSFIQRDPKNFAKITDLVPLQPYETRIEARGNSFVYKTKLYGADKELQPYEVLHLMNPSNNGYWGRGALDELREILGIAVACDTFAQRYFANANVVDWWSTDQVLSQDDVDVMQSQLNQSGSGLSNAHQSKIAIGNLKPIGPTTTPEASQLLSTRQFNAEEICRAMNIPPPIAGLLTRATWANIEHLGIDYVNHLRTWAVPFEQEINRKLFAESELDTYFAELNLDSLERADKTTRYQNYDLAVKGGWLTPYRVATIENLPTDGCIDIPMMPMNVTPATSININATVPEQVKSLQENSLNHDGLIRRAIGQFATKEWKSLESAVRKGVDARDWAKFYDDKLHLLAENLVGILPAEGINSLVGKYRESALKQLDDALTFDAIPELIDEIKQREAKWNYEN